eukprot:SAG11_NODE_449_length_9392_cov_16.435381_5_plen_51_part_00
MAAGAPSADSYEARNIEKDQLVKNLAKVVAQIKVRAKKAPTLLWRELRWH